MSLLAQASPGLQPSIPAGFRGIEPQVHTAEWTDLRKLAQALHEWAPIWHIEHRPQAFRLVKPLRVNVHSEEGFVFATNETLSICGTGSSLEEAMADFSIHVVHFFNYYRSLPAEKVTGDAIRLKQIFTKLFVEE